MSDLDYHRFPTKDLSVPAYCPKCGAGRNAVGVDSLGKGRSVVAHCGICGMRGYQISLLTAVPQRVPAAKPAQKKPAPKVKRDLPTAQAACECCFEAFEYTVWNPDRKPRFCKGCRRAQTRIRIKAKRQWGQ